MSTTVGAYQAKTHLPELLERVTRGERITITRHGKPIALLVPVHDEQPNVRQVLAAMKDFQRHQAPALGADLSIRELIEEGRRV